MVVCQWPSSYRGRDPLVSVTWALTQSITGGRVATNHVPIHLIWFRWLPSEYYMMYVIWSVWDRIALGYRNLPLNYQYIMLIYFWSKFCWLSLVLWWFLTKRLSPLDEFTVMSMRFIYFIMAIVSKTPIHNKVPEMSMMQSQIVVTVKLAKTYPFITLLDHLAVLFDKPKPEACWRGRTYRIYVSHSFS